jgi:hypothetical protein
MAIPPNSNSTPPAADELPRHAASDGPVTRAYRIAFHVWVLCVLLTVVVTLLLYLIDKIYLAANR